MKWIACVAALVAATVSAANAAEWKDGRWALTASAGETIALDDFPLHQVVEPLAKKGVDLEFKLGRTSTDRLDMLVTGVVDVEFAPLGAISPTISGASCLTTIATTSKGWAGNEVFTNLPYRADGTPPTWEDVKKAFESNPNAYAMTPSNGSILDYQMKSLLAAKGIDIDGGKRVKNPSNQRIRIATLLGDKNLVAAYIGYPVGVYAKATKALTMIQPQTEATSFPEPPSGGVVVRCVDLAEKQNAACGAVLTKDSPKRCVFKVLADTLRENEPAVKDPKNKDALKQSITKINSLPRLAEYFAKDFEGQPYKTGTPPTIDEVAEANYQSWISGLTSVPFTLADLKTYLQFTGRSIPETDYCKFIYYDLAAPYSCDAAQAWIKQNKK